MNFIKHKSKKEIKKLKNIEIEKFDKEIKDLSLQEIYELQKNLELELKEKINSNRSIILSKLKYPKYSSSDAIQYSRIVIALGVLTSFTATHLTNAVIGFLTFASISGLGLFSIWKLPSLAEQISNLKENKIMKNNDVLVEKINILNKEKISKNIEKEKSL